MKDADLHCDVLIIGAGLSGMAASIFALEHGLSAVQAGVPGESIFAAGLLDLMGVHPVSEGRLRDDPFKAVADLVADEPRHPYAKLSRDDIAAAMDAFTGFLDRAGLGYRGHEDRNVRVLTPVGTEKTTYRAPESMWSGVAALETKAPCLLVDFEGLKGFSARQIVETQKNSWPGLRRARIPFPDMRGELVPEKIAFFLEGAETRAKLAEAVRPLLAGEEYLGFPAVLGQYRPRLVHGRLEELLGLKIFEIPTMPPGVTGLRLKTALENELPKHGLTLRNQDMVLGRKVLDNGDFLFDLGRFSPQTTVRAKAAVLCTGRFFGKGLRADRTGVVETVFDLPVVQPESREQWHAKNFFDPGGNPINRAGLETDAFFRPLGADGKPVWKNLHAAGAVLAHQDWMRSKCGAGLAVSTARAAVGALAAGL